MTSSKPPITFGPRRGCLLVDTRRWWERARDWACRREYDPDIAVLDAEDDTGMFSLGDKVRGDRSGEMGRVVGKTSMETVNTGGRTAREFYEDLKEITRR